MAEGCIGSVRQCPCPKCLLAAALVDSTIETLETMPLAEAKRYHRDYLAGCSTFTGTPDGGMIVVLHGKVMAHVGAELVRAAFEPEAAVANGRHSGLLPAG